MMQAAEQRQLNAAEDRHKALTADFDRFLKVAEQKQWTFGDWVRALPVIDAFQSPTKIQQVTLDELPTEARFVLGDTHAPAPAGRAHCPRPGRGRVATRQP